MTILKKRKEKKGLLYIIAIAIMVFAIACSGNKPTQSSDFAEIDYDLPVVTNGSGDNAVVSTTISKIDVASGDSPVIIVSGNKVILAYEQNGSIQYRASIDGGNKISKAQTLSDSGKYPYIFFDGSSVSAVVTKYDSQLGPGMPLFEINGTFEIQNGEVGYIKISENKAMEGIVVDNNVGGNAALKNEKYFGQNATAIRTAAGAGTGIGNSRKLPLSQVGGTTYLVLEGVDIQTAAPSSGVSGNGWNLLAGSKKTTKEANEVMKIDANGQEFKTSEFAEKSGAYSIKNDGTITGINSNPKVGDGTTEASIAATDDGYIYTFTKETSGLVLRKFSIKITETAIK